MNVKTKYAFISYNHRDVKWAKWLRRKLEWYRLPSEIHNEFEDSRYLRPVFRDRDELGAGILNKELRRNLETSKFLIVICSPNSASSSWVNDEVTAFISMGRAEFIIPFIIDGSPQESFPPVLLEWNRTNPDNTLLGISIKDDGVISSQKAFIRIVSHLLEVEFDTLWRRHKREQFHRRLSLTLSIPFAGIFLYWFCIPVSITIELEYRHCNLPAPFSSVISIGGSDYDVIRHNGDSTFFVRQVKIDNLPGYYRLQDLPVAFKADRFYEDLTDTLSLGLTVRQSYTLSLVRDSSFAVYAGRVYSDTPAGVRVRVGSKEVTTDSTGYFYVSFPILEQSESKSVSLSRDGCPDKIYDEQAPGHNIGFLYP